MGDGDFLKIVEPDHLGQLFDVALWVIELGAGHRNRFPLQKLLMKPGKGHRHAVCGKKQTGAA